MRFFYRNYALISDFRRSGKTHHVINFTTVLTKEVNFVAMNTHKNEVVFFAILLSHSSCHFGTRSEPPKAGGNT
jgi:hypothetical protein